MRRREFWLILILQLQGAIRAKMSKFIVIKIQPMRLRDLGHVTRIDQSETSILRFRDFLRSTVEAQNIRPLIGQFWSRGLNKKNEIDLFFIKNHFSLLFLTHSFPLYLLLSFLYLDSSCTLPFNCVHFVPCDDRQFICLPIVTYLLLSSFHSLYLLCPLWWSPVYLFSLSSSQHLPLVLLITSSALAFVIACALGSFVYLNMHTYLSWVVTSVARFEPVTTPTAVQRITICAAEHFPSYLSLEVSLPWHDPAAFYTDVQRTTNWYYPS